MTGVGNFAELLQLLIERITAKERVIDPATIELDATGQALLREGAWLWRPRTGAGR